MKKENEKRMKKKQIDFFILLLFLVAFPFHLLFWLI